MTKRIKIIFTISILLNLILIGVVAGGFYKRHNWNHLPVNVSEQTRDILKQNMEVSRDKMHERFQEIKEKKKTLKKIIEAEEFDLEKYNTATEAILNDKNIMARHKAVVMGKTLSELPRAERQALSKRILQGITGGRKGKHRKARHKPKMEDRTPE